MGKKNKNKKNKNKGNVPVINSSHKTASVVKELKETVKNRPMKLRFSPTAWAKFIFMRDVGNTEVGGFAVTMPDDLLYVNDFILPKQECGYASVDFNNESVADFMDDMVDKGFKPEQFLRIWIHTHPNMSPNPSMTDEKTFDRVFGKCDWAVMAIISSDGDQYCRLQINGGPFPGSFEIPIEVDYESYNFPASDSEAWAKEYEDNVEEATYTSYAGSGAAGVYGGNNYSHYNWDDDEGWEGYPHYVNRFKGGQVKPAGFTFPKKDEEEDAAVSSDIEDRWDKGNFNVVPVKTHAGMNIPSELLSHLNPNQMSLLENMSPYEREYVLDALRKRLKTGD